MKDKYESLMEYLNTILRVTLMPLLVVVIRLYQQYISPYKGYSCSHAHHHGGMSCSAHALNALASQDFFTAIAMIWQRRKDCQAVAKQQGFSYSKLYTKSGMAVVALSFVTGCSGSGDDTDTPTNQVTSPTNPAPITEATKSVGMVELGAVEGATITVQTLDGYTLATATTNVNGFFSVDIDSLKHSVNSYGADIKFVKVTSTGGTDTDPNDDGIIVENEKKTVQGTVVGIVSLDTLYQAKEYRINFISTALVDILGSEQDVSEEQLSYIVKRLGVHDINGDGIVDIKDLNSYKMTEDKSVAENELRNGYLEYIHDGNTESQKLFIDDLKYEIGFTRPLVTKKNGYYEVNLAKTDSNNKIYYGIVVDKNKPSFEEYTGQTLYVDNGNAIFYQECSDSYGCYKLQKVFFYDSDYFMDYDYEPIEDNFVEVAKKRSQVYQAKQEYNQAVEELEILKEKQKELSSNLESSSVSSNDGL